MVFIVGLNENSTSPTMTCNISSSNDASHGESGEIITFQWRRYNCTDSGTFINATFTISIYRGGGEREVIGRGGREGEREGFRGS